MGSSSLQMMFKGDYAIVISDVKLVLCDHWVMTLPKIVKSIFMKGVYYLLKSGFLYWLKVPAFMVSIQSDFGLGFGYVVFYC